MDVRIDNEWKTIYPNEARLSLQANPHLRRGPEEMTHVDISNLLAKAKNRPLPRVPT